MLSIQRHKKSRADAQRHAEIEKAGNLLFSQAVTHQVPSAACGLTIVFGMGTGVSHRRIITGQLPE